MVNSLRIGDLESRPGHRSVTVSIGGDGRRWFIESSVPRMSLVLDPFLAGALLPAAAIGDPVEVDGPVSEAFVAQVPSIQRVFEIWRRDPHRPDGPFLLSPQVRALNTASTEVGTRRALLFSGSVHSVEALMRLRDDIDAVIHVEDATQDGATQADATELTTRASDPGIAAAAADFGVELVRVRTNARALFARYVDGATYTGALVASAALALAPEFGTVHLATTIDVRNLGPAPTNPLLDVRYSAGGQRIVPGPVDVTWFDKLRTIAATPGALAHLRVCGAPLGACGTCPRCVLTVMGLQALGLSVQRTPLGRASVDPAEVTVAVRSDPRIADAASDIATWLDDRGQLPDHVAAIRAGLTPPPRVITRREALRALLHSGTRGRRVAAS